MAFRFARRAGKYALGTGTLVAPVMAYEAYTFRPRGSQDKDFHEMMRGVDRAPTNPIDKFFYDLTMTFCVGFVSTVFHTVVHRLHDLELIDHDKFLKYVAAE